MTTAQSYALDTLHWTNLQEVLHTTGPCVTLILPPYHPGESAKPRAELLRSYLQLAHRDLRQRAVSNRDSSALLEILRDLAKEESLTESHWGRAILRSPEVFQQFQLTHSGRASWTVGGCFAVRKLLRALWAPRDFYILALSKEAFHLFRCNCEQAEAVALPTAPSLRPGLDAITSYYRWIDNELPKALHDIWIPLLLAGTDEEVEAYRTVSSYPRIVAEKLPGGEAVGPDLLWMANSLLGEEETIRQAEALRHAKEFDSGALTLDEPVTILRAAIEGGVQELYLRDRADRIDVFERDEYRSWGPEDVLNLAAVETLAHGGRAFELPRTRMVEDVFAIRRA